ncbi:putative steryl acetyl hydrolase mug81 [Batrachochytrium dendrobatidis]|nr:putative steryl acetyl hydrolase mug81 [Batrachochytrium dendrobatidis]
MVVFPRTFAQLLKQRNTAFENKELYAVNDDEVKITALNSSQTTNALEAMIQRLNEQIKRHNEFNSAVSVVNPALERDLPFKSQLDIFGAPQKLMEDTFSIHALVDETATNVDSSEESLTSVAVEDSFDKTWLLSACNKFIHEASMEISAEQLCTDIFSILRNKSNDDEIQAALVDLMGYSDIDFVSTLLTNRQMIVDSIMQEAICSGRLEEATNASLVNRNEDSNMNTKARPIYGTQVTVQSESEKQLQKAMRKEWKKQSKHANDEFESIDCTTLLGFDGDRLRQARANQLYSAASAPPVSNKNPGSGGQQVSYPNVYQSGTGGSTLSLFGSKYALPVGTVRVDEKDFEEVEIPITKASPVRTTESRVLISSMDKIAQSVFKGYESLNRVQSIVYPVAYETNENMLVCAPTGAGKTDVAMLTVLRVIHQHCVDGVIDLDSFKIVYVAPMKALAAEIARKFSTRLAALKVKVRELTGDMQLTKVEISETQMIVTTPEKWDVVTRKGVGDTELSQKVRLLIIDEVHLLHEERGAVIESIVARTLRLVESSQSLIRIVGLSATLPNYVDVAAFLSVNLYQGLFFFDASFRPVPLEQHFIGVKAKAGSIVYKTKLNEICFEKIAALVCEGYQAMVFVHARKETVNTAQALHDLAMSSDKLGMFDCTQDPQFGIFVKEVQKSKNKEMKELFSSGFGIHHAGMLRSDRTLTERLFEKGLIKVLCCTATLAWGVNLPAYAVVIKGTQVYNAEKGAFVDLSILDVLQIFGRAGRPQYEDRGIGYIITTHDKLTHYLSSMTQQHPIESTFSNKLVDNLNAEISLGTVTNLDEAVKWLSYTYLYVRMRKNPFQYGLGWDELTADPLLGKRRRDLLVSAANTLHKTQMIVFDERTGYLTPKDLGRVASNFYISHSTIEIFNTMMRPRMTEADVIAMLSMSNEFENIKLRNEETVEMKGLLKDQCVCAVKGGVDTNYGKTNILLQSYISRSRIDDFALVSDTAYVAQNSARILRAIFDIAMSRNWGPTASVVLSLCKTVDKRMWSFEHPLAQFDLPVEIITKLERSVDSISMDALRDMTANELGDLVRHHRMGDTVSRCVMQFPTLYMEASIAPITRTILRISLHVTPDFAWNDKVHGKSEPWWIWVEDPESTDILYSEYFLVRKREHGQTQKLGFTIPIPKTLSTSDELPPQVYIRAVSDRWIGAENILPVSFKHLILPELNHAPYTDLLDLQPLSITALKNPIIEEICRPRFQYFNPVQTQIFHTLYQTRHNALVGAPTGSGKTIAAELALWSTFRDFPKSKVVYIAPLKALVRERVQDWRTRVAFPMCRRLVELTGDVTPDIATIEGADIIVTTPEKWDGVSRSWKTRKYVTDVSLVIIDEIHLLGGDRGPILEVIVSRMNYIAEQTKKPIRVVGLSTALANACDLGDWLNIRNMGLFNFRHSVRPVPLEIFIEGYPGKHYCPRMISMNKPTYAAIMTHSPSKPVIVFVSSRRQTRLTAQDLISLCANNDNPRHFLHMPEEELEMLVASVKDQSLKLALQFGIGLHHAGLIDTDRKLSEELFVNGKIQVLIATSTLAWGVNFPAHLVVVKGTEFYDAKTKGYVDFPITDVLQMMGRAGRPQFDDSGVAVILVHDVKKNFYKKFLHEPFPVESSLHTCLEDHFNAEIAAGTIKSKQDAMDYLTWTYLYRRVRMNPTFYGAEDASDLAIVRYLSNLIVDTLESLRAAECVNIIDDFDVESTPFGKIASYYYLRYKTIGILKKRLLRKFHERHSLQPGQKVGGHYIKLVRIISDAAEYDELPVRHNEDIKNRELESVLPFKARVAKDSQSGFDAVGSDVVQYDCPHLKTFLLLQAHLVRQDQLPCSDYHTDTISVLDQSIRIVQAMIDVCVLQGYLATTLGLTSILQCIKQARWESDSPLLTLPHMTPELLGSLKLNGIVVQDLAQLCFLNDHDRGSVLRNIPGLSVSQCRDIFNVVTNMPAMTIKYEIKGAKEKNGRWMVSAGKVYCITLSFVRERPYVSNYGEKGMYQIHSPRFPKLQTEGWWVILGDQRCDELWALKRCSPVNKEADKKKIGRVSDKKRMDVLCTSMSIEAPSLTGEYDFDIFLVSDGYRGLDKQQPLRIYVG